jgi:hypothetical protein
LASRIQMKESARRKLNGAEHLMDRANPLPSEGAYLASIASECSLKTLLMTRHSIQDTSEISEEHHLSECFRGKGAHNLNRIFRHLRGGVCTRSSRKSDLEADDRSGPPLFIEIR